MKHLGQSRRELFVELDQPSPGPAAGARLRVRPAGRKPASTLTTTWSLKSIIYSVPYTLTGKEVHIRATEKTIEIFYQRQRVASHPRSKAKGRFSTHSVHMPPEHQFYSQWSPERFLRWAREIGAANHRTDQPAARCPRASRAGLPHLPGRPRPGQTLLPGAPGGRLPRANAPASTPTRECTTFSRTSSTNSPWNPRRTTPCRRMTTSAAKTTTIEELPMLTQPLLEKLSQLNLSAFRSALTKSSLKTPTMPNCPLKNASACWSMSKSPAATTTACSGRIKAAHFPLPGHPRRPRPVPRAWSQTSPDPGTRPGRMGPTPSQHSGPRGHRGGEDLSWLVHWGGLPARPNSMSATCALPACSNPSLSPRPMAPIPNCCGPWPAPTCSFSMTGCATPSPALKPKTCSKSSTTATAARATLVATQVPVSDWHARIPDPTLVRFGPGPPHPQCLPT